LLPFSLPALGALLPFLVSALPALALLLILSSALVLLTALALALYCYYYYNSACVISNTVLIQRLRY
jgi:hypothetical protein